MKAKEYLSQLRYLRSKSHRIREEISTIESSMLSVSGVRYDKPNIQSSPENTMEAEIIRLEDAKQKLEAELWKYVETYTTIVQQIRELHAIGLHKDILFMRYVDGMPFWKIADELHYDQKYIANRHGIALQEFQKQYLT